MNKKIDQQFIDNFSEAERLCNENRLDESLRKYQTLLKQQPDHVSVLNNIGLVYEKMRDFNKAAEYYEKCTALMPDQIVLINNLANAYTRLDRWSDAYPLLKTVVATDFDNERNSEKYALCLFNTKSKEQTKTFVTSAINKYPDNQVLNRLLGKVLLYLDAHREGLQYLQKGAGTIEFDADGVKYLN